MIAAAFPPPFARYGETLGLPRDGAIPLPELLGPKHLAPLAARYAASFPGGSAATHDGGATRAALSLWSQHYLLALIPCAAAAALVLRRDLPLDLAGMGALLEDGGQPCHLCLPHGGCATTESCPVRRLSPLLRLHLAPLAAALAQAGLSPLIVWSNAAAVLAWTLRVIAAPEPDRAAIWTAMSAPDWPDGHPNPFRPVIGRDPATRRICCLRVRLPGMGRCLDCPVRGN